MGKGCGSLSRRALRRAVSLTLETLEGRRLLSAGSLDSAFGSNGILSTDFPGAATTDVPASSVKVTDNKIVILGTASGQAVMARYILSNGARDATFGISGDGVVKIPASVLSSADSIAVDGLGNLLVGGVDGSNDGAIARFSPNGALDRSFGTNGVADDNIANSGVGGVVTLNGDVYGSVFGTGDFTLVKFDTSGSLVGNFNGGLHGSASAIAVHGNSILMAGVSTQPIPNPDPAGDTGQDATFVQFDPSGQLEMGFKGGGQRDL